MESGSPRSPSASTSTHYEVLGVSSDASAEDIVSAYRVLARKHHPDKGGDSASFQRLQEAKDVLSDATSRAVYDRSLMLGSGSGAHASAQQHQQQQQQQRMRTPDQVVNITISAREAKSGCARVLRLSRKVVCGTCSGTGLRDPTSRTAASATMTCPSCRGQRVGPMGPCAMCIGSGVTVTPAHACTACRGVRMVNENARITVNIPAGCADGHDVRLRGESGSRPGMEAGDIVAVVRVQMPENWQAVCDSLITSVEISALEAIVGGVVTLAHPCGSTLRLRFDGGVQPGDVISFPGLGLNEDGVLGLQVKVRIPKLTPAGCADTVRAALLQNTTATAPVAPVAPAASSTSSSADMSGTAPPAAAAPAHITHDRHETMSAETFQEKLQQLTHVFMASRGGGVGAGHPHPFAHTHVPSGAQHVQCAQS